MGFWSTLATIGGDIAGSFVGDPGLGSQIVGAAGALGAAGVQSSQESKAANAQKAGAAQAGALLSPYAQTGVDALNKQRAMYGLAPISASATPPPAPVAAATTAKSGPTFGIATLPTALEADPGSGGPQRIPVSSDNGLGGPFASMTRSSFNG